jgi:glucose/arabinose dehydrogenase
MVRSLSTLLAACFAFVACSSDDLANSRDAGRPDAVIPPVHDASFERVINPDGASTRFCDLPGSVQFTDAGKTMVDGGMGADRIAFLTLPTGFCAHWFANVGNTRQLRFSPSGDLFVASPTTGTTGGGIGGQASILVLPDDDGDGVADPPITFLSMLPSTQGMMFAKGFFYYQNGAKILRQPFSPGDRQPTGTPVTVLDGTGWYTSGGHWPKPLDQADDGTIYVGNGGDQGEGCDPTHPFHGGILRVDGSVGGTPVAKGFRNPIALRCQRGHNLCFAVELAMDFSAEYGGREKLVPIRQGDDWGYPCCFTKDRAAPNIAPVPDCSGTAPESVSFLIGDTPFGVDFEPGRWAEPFAGAAFVTVHGAYATWAGTRLAVIQVDPGTGLPRPGSNLPNVSNGAMGEFATGWDDGSRTHGRPSALTFSNDGRLFVGNDNNGDIFWVAPLDLTR